MDRMRTLYESIVDSDSTLKDKMDNSILPNVIMEKLKEYFNEYLERESNVRRVGGLYPLGLVDDELYDKEDITGTEKFIINAIKYMYLDIKRLVPHTLIDIETRREKSGVSREIHLKIYTVKLKNADKTYLLEFDLRTKVTMSNSEVIRISIWTKNQELAELI